VLFITVAVAVAGNTKTRGPVKEEMVGVAQEQATMLRLQPEPQTLVVAVVVQTDMESGVVGQSPERQVGQVL
jgi:hypothetical protein